MKIDNIIFKSVLCHNNSHQWEWYMWYRQRHVTGIRHSHWWEFLWRNSFTTICLRIYHLYIEWSYFYGKFYRLDKFKFFFLYAERKFENVDCKHLTIFICVFINNIQNPPFLRSKKCLIFVYLSIYKTTSSNTNSHSSVHDSKKVWMMCKCVKHWHGDYTLSLIHI